MENEVQRQLKISAENITRQQAENLPVKLVNASVDALISSARNEKSFDEAARENVKTVVVETGKEIVAQEIKRQVAGAKILELGLLIKDSVFKLVGGEIDEEQFAQEIARKGTRLALQTVGAFAGAETFGAAVGQAVLPIPVAGAIVGSMVASAACELIFKTAEIAKSQLDNSADKLAAQKRKFVAELAAEALAEMNRQRALLQKYLRDEQIRWDKNLAEGFQLIHNGTFSNDAEIIAAGLDKILQNVGGRVTFASAQEFDDFFSDENSVLKI